MEIPDIIKQAIRFKVFDIRLGFLYPVVFGTAFIIVFVFLYLAGFNLLTFLLGLIVALIAGSQYFKLFGGVVMMAEKLLDKSLSGEKNVRMPHLGSNEFGRVATAFNKLFEQNERLVNKLLSTVKQIDATVEMLSRQSHQNSETAASQSSSVAETTATIKELATSSERIVDETRSVVKLAEETQASAQKGTQAIAEMLERMSEIQKENQQRIQEIVILGKKAQEIEKVMDIINDIASNTKIIAFNAAIEASSSGEEGKRFGTVASEIRKLASTVSSSTNEIRDKIKEIQKTTNELVIVSEEETKKIQNGVDTATVMVTELSDILEKADKTLDWIRQISMATQQQLTASNQIATVLQDISEGIRTFSEAINSSKDTAQQLKALAGDLSGLMKIEQGIE